MNPNIDENLYPYGDGFDSIDQVLNAVEKRMASGEQPVRGAAIFYPTENDVTVRHAVRILPDGQIINAHAEYF